MRLKSSFVVFAIFSLALAIRIYKLDFQSFWMDEYYNINLALKPNFLWGGPDNVPPLYINLLKLWLAVFPVSEITARLLGALLGATSIFAIYLLGKELFGKPAGILASFFLALSATHVDYCQEAKYYSLALLLLMFMQLHYVRFLKYRRVTNLLSYGVFSVLTFYAHYYFVFLFLIQGAHLWFFRKRFQNEIPKIIRVQIIAFLLFLPCVFYLFFNPYKATQSLAWLSKPNPDIFWGTAFAILTGQGWQNIAPGIAVCAFFLNVFIIFVIAWKRNLFKFDLFASLTFLWFFLPFALFYLFSVTFFSIFHTRYLLMSLPAFFLFLSWLMTSGLPVAIEGNAEKMMLRRLFAAGIGIFLALILHLTYGHALIEKMYNGQAPPFLNNLIIGQASWPLESYFKKADTIFCATLFLALPPFIFLIRPQKFQYLFFYIILACVLLMANVTTLLHYFNHPVRPQIREAAGWLKKNVQRDDKILIKGYYAQKKVFDFYFRRNGSANFIAIDQERQTPPRNGYRWIAETYYDMPSNGKTSLIKSFLGVEIYRQDEK